MANKPISDPFCRNIGNISSPSRYFFPTVITFVDLELEVWDLVQCSLISFCLGSEILVQFGQPQPPKNTQKPLKQFEYELIGTLRLYNFCKFGAIGLRFGTVFANIILPWIRNCGTIRTTLTP